MACMSTPASPLARFSDNPLRLAEAGVKKLFVAFVVVMLSLVGFGQNLNTGLQPFGSFQSPGPDSINLGSLNTHISIPIVKQKRNRLAIQRFY
jgi:hypothetical protein